MDQTSWKAITVKFLQLGYLAPKSRLRLWNNKLGFERCWARSALHLNRLSTLKIWLFVLMHRYGFLGLITDLCISNVWPLFSLLSMQTERPPNYYYFFPFTQLKTASREDLKFCILLLRNRDLWKIAFYVTQGKLTKRGIFSYFHSGEHDPSYI